MAFRIGSSGILDYSRHPITTAAADGLNSKIQTLKKRANGFRSMTNFKSAIYFHCGGLDLYPRLPTHSAASRRLDPRRRQTEFYLGG